MANKSNLLKQILQEVNEMPPLPAVVLKVIQMTKDPNVSASELNKIISMDQSLTANILKLCNSAYYGLPRVISSVTQAIMYLGFHTVRNLVMTTTLHDIYDSETEGYGYGKGGLWRHSIACALGSQILCKKYRPGLNDTAFTAGLLHDVGKLLINKFSSNTYDSLVEVSHNNNLSLVEAEQELFGCDHAEVGAKVADTWNFPQELVQAIGFHHAPDKSQGKQLLTILVHIANVASQDSRISLIENPIVEEISDFAAKTINFSNAEMEDLIINLEQAMKDAENFLNIGK